jgi:hypothetical protein
MVMGGFSPARSFSEKFGEFGRSFIAVMRVLQSSQQFAHQLRWAEAAFDRKTTPFCVVLVGMQIA